MTSSTYAQQRRARAILVSDKVEVNHDGCLRWQGGHNDDGYPYIYIDGKTLGAHRYIYHTLVGDLVPGEPVHHRCDTRDCIRPDHLQRATAADNALDMLARVGYERRLAAVEAILADIAYELKQERDELLTQIADLKRELEICQTLD